MLAGAATTRGVGTSERSLASQNDVVESKIDLDHAAEEIERRRGALAEKGVDVSPTTWRDQGPARGNVLVSGLPILREAGNPSS